MKIIIILIKNFAVEKMRAINKDLQATNKDPQALNKSSSKNVPVSLNLY